MTVRNIKDIHDRLLANVSGSGRPAGEIKRNMNCAGAQVSAIEKPIVVEHWVPLFKDAMGRWEVKSIIRQRSMGRRSRKPDRYNTESLTFQSRVREQPGPKTDIAGVHRLPEPPLLARLFSAIGGSIWGIADY
jgi:hypothetical protein